MQLDAVQATEVANVVTGASRTPDPVGHQEEPVPGHLQRTLPALRRAELYAHAAGALRGGLGVPR